MHTIEQLRSGELAGIKRLTLSCDLESFPEEIFTLADTLEILDLSGNRLSALPHDLHRLHKLRVVFCSNNLFVSLPEVLGQCAQLSMVGFKANRIRTVPAKALPPALRWLILTDNQISKLPTEIGRCTQLQKLMLAGNQLQALPEELASCTKLELLRISANRFASLPACILNLPRLSWLAYAGNPFCIDIESAVQKNIAITNINWDELQIQQQLGEGASGVIHQAVWQGDGTQQVAVKLFKGALTSDGLPGSEMAACVGAGTHPNMIAIHGKIHDHPLGVNGLVMALIDADFRNLAGPPSLDSCTRDIYSADTMFTLDMVMCIALGVASVVRHLHERGLLHGDLYAHNILYSDAGHALLGDFGAASFLEFADERHALALQSIEARAFACLLQELLAYCREDVGNEVSQTILHALAELQTSCEHDNPSVRPLFLEIEQTLQRLRDMQI
ncbi:MAG: leucine-rich repeat-containing protein kinase family protein [Gallionellaceae bacterium]